LPIFLRLLVHRMVFGFPVSIEIFAFSALLAVVSKVLQFTLMDRKAFLASQKQMKEQQKKMQELASKEDAESKKELESLQTQMLENFNKSIQMMGKMMVVSLVVFGPALYFLQAWFGGSLVQLPFPLPIVHRDLSFEITSTISWFWTYIYSSLVSSLIIGAILKALKME